MLDLTGLENFINTDIPQPIEKRKTFQDIAKQPHYENVLSNLYAFFFDINEEHGLKDLFISTFIEMINQKKDTSFQMDLSHPLEIKTEHKTNNRGRIDILIHNNSDAIIIENKVFHYLADDLNDYWESTTQGNKIGAVLSLRDIKK